VAIGIAVLVACLALSLLQIYVLQRALSDANREIARIADEIQRWRRIFWPHGWN
jgi:hypothetical protein